MTADHFHSGMKGLASAMMILGACLISVSPDLAANSALTFSLFFACHIVWASYAFVMKEYSLLWMNIGLIPFDFIAMSVRI
jgi:hypothetical protein